MNGGKLKCAGFSVGPPLSSNREPLKSDYSLLVEEIVKRVKDEEAPMPPVYMNTPLTESELGIMDSWLEEIKNGSSTLKVSKVTLKLSGPDTDESLNLGANTDGQFELPEDIVLKSGLEYQFFFEAYLDSETLLSSWTETVQIPLDGKVDLRRTINYEAPEVTIPIEIESP